ncbi:hypothetical protein HKD37_10G028566 [Glycine soja]
MGTPPPSPPQSDVQSKAMRLTLRTLDQPRPTVNVDDATDRGSGPHKEKFHNYVGLKALKLCKRNLISHKCRMQRKKVMSIVATRWRQFKSAFTTKFVYAKSDGQHKHDPSIHKLGRNLPQAAKPLTGRLRTPPSPIERYAKWKLARTKRYRQMTSQDSLEEQTTQGTFVPHGRDDILNTTIGRPDHGGRVYAVGSGVTISQYYRRTSHASNSSSTSITQQYGGMRLRKNLEILKQELKEAIIIEMSQRGSQFSEPIEANIHVLGARVSTKGSNAETAVNPSGEEHVAHVIPTMGLYVQREHSTQLVTLEKIYEGGSTIHSVLYADDVVKVSVEKVIDGEAEVPLPTSKIQYVRQALDIFIAWSTSLVKLVSDEDSTIAPNKVTQAIQRVNDAVVDHPLRELNKSLVDIYEKPVQLVWDVSRFGIPNVDASLFLTYADVNKIISGDKCLNIAILQLWIIAFKTLKMTSDGKIDQTTPQWIKVKSHVQSGGYECEYYVMRWMWNIINRELKNDWTMWFGDGTPLDIETMTTLQKKWVAYFLRLRSIQCRKL